MPARLLTALLVILLGACVTPAEEARSDGAEARHARPNIVVIMFDDLSPRIRALGDPVAHTPELDRFVAEAVAYPNTFTTSPVCAPSRSALMTGVHQQTLGTMHMRTRGAAGLPGGGPIEYDAVPPAQVKAFPELLRAAGYYTINIGKTDYQFGEPFTIWDDSGAKADWRRRPADRPFFALINLHHTHESYLWPEETRSDNRLVQLVTARNRREFANKERRTDPALVKVPPYLPDNPVVRQDLARLYDNISFDDRNVGRIMATLREQGVLDNTIVIVTADHGDGLPRVKRAIHAEGLRVPFLVRFPDGRQYRDQRLVSFVDVAPTILRWAGASRPTWLQGRPIGDQRRSYAYAAADRFDENVERRKTVVDGRFQYIRNFGAEPFFRPLAFRDQLPTMQELWRLRRAGGLTPAQAGLFQPLPREQLFDLQTDPHTVRDLAGDPAYRPHLARLRKAMDEWLARAPDLSAISEAQLVAKMWPGNQQPVTAAPVAERASNGRVRLASPTPGASIGYRIGADREDGWQLYTRPIDLPAGTVLKAKAIRYGYRESTTTVFPR
jgi:arylsulfatase A-like enzyme